MQKYERICRQLDIVNDLYDKTKDIEYAIRGDDICNFFECETYKNYEYVLDFAKKHNINNVYDIGCAFGLQSETFLNSGINYIGIDEGVKKGFWNEDKFKYINRRYPFNIKTNRDDDLAVSVLCLTWNCYLYNGEDTLKRQCEQLQKDFKHCLLYIDKEKIDFVKKYYTHYEVLEFRNFVYFYND